MRDATPTPDPRPHRRLLASFVPESPRLRLLLLGCALSAGLSLLPFARLMVCFDRCFPAIKGEASYLELADTRLNAWAIAWDLHALRVQPFDLFAANSFYPSPRSLSGSEHLLGVAAQTLPFAGFVSSAAGTYNLALVLSFALLAANMFALLFWATGDPLAASLGGLLAALAPWRFSDISHLQLLGLQWFPLIWLMLGVNAERGASIRRNLLLAAAVSLQLLSCYYLAYYLSFSVAVVFVLLLMSRPTSRRELGGSIGWTIAAYVPFVLASLPYLARSSRGELVAPGFAWPVGVDSIWLALTSNKIVPEIGKNYAMPASGLLLAAISLTQFATKPRGSRMRTWTAILWAIGLGGVLFALGPSRSGWDDPLRMPSRILELYAPGFAQLRVPRRWLILTDTCVAACAGIGLATLREWILRSTKQTRVAPNRARLVQAAIVAFTIFSIDPGLISTVGAFVWPPAADAAYAALSAFPRGATVELPYRNMEGDSHYQLASTRHWQPLLNGYTGYPPPTYDYLMSLAYNLPDAKRLRTLTALTDLRWVVVHKTPEVDLGVWDEAVKTGSFVVVYDDPRTRILEVANRDGGGSRMDWLRGTAVHATTLDGAARGALHLDSSSGRILASGAPFGEFGNVVLTLRNDSDVVWPGADYQRDGLTEIAYRYLPAAGTAASDFQSVPVFEDIAPHDQRRIMVFLEWPRNLDSFRGDLELRLAQRIDGRLRILDLPAAVVPYVPRANAQS